MRRRNPRQTPATIPTPNVPSIEIVTDPDRSKRPSVTSRPELGLESRP